MERVNRCGQPGIGQPGIEKLGPAEQVLQVGELPDRQPGPGEIRVRLDLSGVNPGDAKGRPPSVRVRGTVLPGRGNRRQASVVPEHLVVDLPDEVSDEVGACLGIPAITAHRAVFGDGAVTGQVVLVHDGDFEARVREITPDGVARIVEPPSGIAVLANAVL